jgi:hypothetical protein
MATKKKAKKKSTLKTQPTAKRVRAFLDALDPARRDDAKVLAKLMADVTGEKATMWGPSIVGFGAIHYKYASGHEGDVPLVGFSPRRAAFSVYLVGELFSHPLMAQLGKCKTSKGCLYVKRLADVDVAVLKELVALSVKHAPRVYAA